MNCLKNEVNMKRLVLYIATAVLSFVVGGVAATLWNSRHSRLQTPPPPVVAEPVKAEQPVVEEWPLTKVIVSRALQTHSFGTSKLLKNSDDEIAWRWLKGEIARYPQNWVKLDVSDKECCGVVLYPMRVLDPGELIHINRENNQKGLPPLAKDKRYLPINVYRDTVICPSWSGYIDVEEAKLVYFLGESG
jgi:hypothetical protein